MSCISKVERKLWRSHSPSLQLKCWAVSCGVEMGKWEQTLLTTVIAIYILILCAQMQCLKGAGIFPFTGISAQMLALFVEGEEGRRAEGWTSEFSICTSELPTWALCVPPYTWTRACILGTLPVLSSSYSCASNRYYLSRKLALLTSFDHHSCSKTTTITLIHKTISHPHTSTIHFYRLYL